MTNQFFSQDVRNVLLHKLRKEFERLRTKEQHWKHQRITDGAMMAPHLKQKGIAKETQPHLEKGHLTNIWTMDQPP